METFILEVTGGLSEEENKFLNDWQDYTANYISVEAARLEISEGAMADIYYLRTRSRWTQEKENHLIHLAKTGQPFPNILAGEF